jgi:hypothetical protein
MKLNGIILDDKMISIEIYRLILEVKMILNIEFRILMLDLIIFKKLK